MSGRGRAGEADRVYAGIAYQGFADDASVAHDEVEHARGYTRAGDELGKRPRRSGHELGGLEHDAIAVAKRRRDLPGGNRDRKIPRCDDRDHADRLARDLDVDAGPHRRDLFSGEAQRLAAEELEDLSCANDLA